MRALVLSGGGSKGQYHVGALEHLLGGLGRKYDIVCGVSVGALVAAYVCQYAVGEEWQASIDLTNLFLSIENKHVWQNWFPLKQLHGLYKNSYFDSSPLADTINKHLCLDKLRTSGKQLRVGATSLNTGEYRVFTQNDPDLRLAVLASASFPGAFSPVVIGGELWSDGGICTTTPIKAAADAGATEVDIILASPSFAPHRADKAPRAHEVAMRALEIQSVAKMNSDIDRALYYNELIGAGFIKGKTHIKFNIIKPDGVLTHNALHFSPKEAKLVQLQGFNDARKIL
jgi:NTE family protein